MSVQKISNAILGVGVDDTTIDLFESQYPVPTGVSYNSYVILDEKVAILDTVDNRATDAWLANLTEALGDRMPEYLVVSHMEPDHGANIARLAAKYPDMKVVGNAKTFVYMEQFFGPDAVAKERRVVVKDGESLSLGSHTLTFAGAVRVNVLLNLGNQFTACHVAVIAHDADLNRIIAVSKREHLGGANSVNLHRPTFILIFVARRNRLLQCKIIALS